MVQVLWGSSAGENLKQKMEVPSTFLRILVDDGGCLGRLLPLCSTKEAAARLLAYLARRPVLVSAERCALYAFNELAVIFSFYLEALEGADLEQRYTWAPETPGRYGLELMAQVERLSPEAQWEQQLNAVGVETMTLEAYSDLHGCRPPFARCGLDIDIEDF